MDARSALRLATIGLVLVVAAVLLGHLFEAIGHAVHGMREQQRQNAARLGLAVPIGAEWREVERGRATSHASFFATERLSDAVRRGRDVSDCHGWGV